MTPMGHEAQEEEGLNLPFYFLASHFMSPHLHFQVFTSSNFCFRFRAIINPSVYVFRRGSYIVPRFETLSSFHVLKKYLLVH